MILIDARSLGYPPGGILRFSEEFIITLLKYLPQNSCSLTLLNELSFDERAKKRLQEDIFKPYTEFDSALKDQKLSPNGYNELMQLLNFHKNNSSSPLFFKLIRELVRIKHRQVVKSNKRKLAGFFKDIKIYHSLHENIPGNIHSLIPAVIYTVYDVIPIIHPQFFEEQAVKGFFHEKLKYFTKDTEVIVISQYTKNDLCNVCTALDPDNVHVIYPGLRPSIKEKAEDSHPISDNSVFYKYNVPRNPYVLSLCTVEPRKNLPFLIKTFANLIESREDLKDLNLVIAGRIGWKEEHFKEAYSLIKKHNKRIFLTGVIAEEDLTALYKNATAFIYPSFYEGFGLPVIEAMAFGVPTITSNTSSLPEAAGDAAILIDPTNNDELADAILKVYNSDSLRAEMKEKSLANVKRFSWDENVQKTIEIYKKHDPDLASYAQKNQTRPEKTRLS